MTEKHSGSCLCGRVSFEVTGEFQNFFFCHCSHCRKGTGSAHAANLFSTTAQLAWTGGEDSIKTYALPGTRHAKSFCTECGAALPMQDSTGSLVMVPAGSLDSDLAVKPTAHIFMASRANWDEELETAPKFDKYPE